MTKAQIGRMLIFLKEAAGQIDNARVVAINAADPYTVAAMHYLLRELVAEIDRLEVLHRSAV
jgi:hypothetical protein